MQTPTVATLKLAIDIQLKIERLEQELRRILGKENAALASKAVPQDLSITRIESNAPRSKRRKISPEARARIVAAQKIRWAKFRAASSAK